MKIPINPITAYAARWLTGNKPNFARNKSLKDGIPAKKHPQHTPSRFHSYRHYPGSVWRCDREKLYIQRDRHDAHRINADRWATAFRLWLFAQSCTGRVRPGSRFVYRFIVPGLAGDQLFCLSGNTYNSHCRRGAVRRDRWFDRYLLEIERKLYLI